MADSLLETLIDIKHKYRYIATMSRNSGTLILFGRLDSEAGQVFLHESAGNKTPTKEKDYLEVHALAEIKLESNHNIVIFLNPPATVNEHYTHYSVYRTKNIIAKNADFAVVGQTFIYNDDVPVVKIGIFTGFGVEPDGIVAEFTFISPTFNIQDVGSTLTSETGTEYTIIALVVDSGSSVTLRVTKTDQSPIGSPTGKWYFIGAIDHFICDLKFGSNGDPIADKTSGSGTRNFISSDIGKQIYWSDGQVSIIKSINNPDEAVLYAKSGLPTELDDSGEICGVIGFKQRCYNDTITDSILAGYQESGESLFFLQTRNFRPLPNGTLGAVKGGAYFVSSTDESRYFYSQVAQFERTGSYHPTLQLNSKPVGVLTRLAGYPEALVIFGKNFTYYLDTTLETNGGFEELGEFIVVYVDPRLVDDKVGCPHEGCAALADHGGEYIFTNEPAIRYFDGFKYSDNLALNKIQESEITQLTLNVIMGWDKKRGLNIWGVNASNTTE